MFQTNSFNNIEVLSRQKLAVVKFRANLPKVDKIDFSKLPNTQVLLRSRPTLTEHDLKIDETFESVTTNANLAYVHKEKTTAGLASGEIVNKKYELHNCFGPLSTNENIFESSILPLVELAKSGGTACALAYGQTGSGKTHTMSAMSSLVAVSLADLELVESFSFYELRGDICLDGLNDGERAKLNIRTDENNVDVVQNLTKLKIMGKDHLLETLVKCSEIRATASTSRNSQSSRSHAFSIFNLSNGGSLKLVDLAGSENKEDAHAHADAGGEEASARLKEMVEINGSLGDLKECIRLNLVNAKSAKKQHVPFRRNKLTRLLKDSLDSESEASMSGR